MKSHLAPHLAITFTLLSATGVAQEFASQTQAPTIIELYTSEGCSSCPPAERFISTFAMQEDPFEHVIPLAYHVDYWNYLGWNDRFSKPQYSLRQRRQAEEGNLSQVYTPGFVVNNQEWRRWFNGDRKVPTNQGEAGQLSARLEKGTLNVNYTGHPEVEGPYLLHIAYLGMGISTDVKAGENKGRTLQQDYVVLDNISQISQTNNWLMQLTPPPEKGQQQTGIAIWVSAIDSLNVLQADAALLKESSF